MSNGADQLGAAEHAAAAEDPHDAPAEGVGSCSKKGKPKRLQLVLVGRDGPYAEVPYELYADGRLLTASKKLTGKDGRIDEDIGAAASVELHVWFDAFPHPEIYRLKVVDLPPVDTEEGLAIRLRNLGGGVPPGGKAGPEHVRRFQERWGLAVTGTIDETLRADLTRLYGS